MIWFLPLVLCIIANPYTLYTLSLKWKACTAKTTGAKLLDTNVRWPCWGFFSAFTQLLTVVMRIFTPARLGHDIAISFTGAAFIFGFFETAILLVASFIELAVKQSRMKDAAAKARVKTMKALMQKLFWVTRISIILGSALIVAAVFSEKSSTAPMCIAASYFFYGMGVSILIINAVSTLGSLVKDMEELNEGKEGAEFNGMVAAIAKKMKFLRTEIIKNGPSNTVINLAMAFFPQIGRFAPYQCLIAYSAIMFIIIVACYVMGPTKASAARRASTADVHPTTTTTTLTTTTAEP